MSLVSVIIPVYNHAKQAEACLKSLSQQTHRELEVILVDDASKDQAVQKLQAHQDWYPYTFLRLPTNQGAPTARNQGFALSRGEFLLFLDADIILQPNAIEVMVENLSDHPEAAYAYPSFIFGWKTFQGRAFDADALKQTNFIHTSALIRREAFPGFDPSLTKFQDWDLWLTMLEKGNRGVWIDQVLFRIETGGTMSTWMPKFAYKLPWPLFGWTPRVIKRYRDADTVIRHKHHLSS